MGLELYKKRKVKYDLINCRDAIVGDVLTSICFFYYISLRFKFHATKIYRSVFTTRFPLKYLNGIWTMELTLLVFYQYLVTDSNN